MPPHRAFGNHELRIAISGGEENPVFLPGQNLRGFVERLDSIDANYTLLDIRLHGRTKVKLVELRPPMTGKTHRSQIVLLDGRNAALELNNGPVVQEPEALGMPSWEWALRIPDRCNPDGDPSNSSKRKVDGLFIPVSQQDVPLPASFLHQATAPCMSMTCYVEYYLEALMMDGRGGLYIAIMPVTVGHVPTRLSAVEYHTRNRCKLSGRASSHRLFEGTQNARLSIWQNIEQAFDIDVVPRFAYQIFLDTPSVLQPGNINPIPFTMWPFQDPDACSELMRHSYQMVYVERFYVWIKETVRMVATGEDKTYRCKTSHAVDVYNYKRPPGLPEDDPKLFKFLCPGPPSYIGKLMNILIPSSEDLHPSFKTYNIKVSHELSWKLTLSVVGVKTTFLGSCDVVIKGPPEPATIAPVGEQRGAWEDKFVRYFDALAVEEEGKEMEEEEMDHGCC